jgi:hypothetical protein
VSELLDLAIAGAGGRRRWRKVEGISAHVRSGGLLMRLKGQGPRFRDYGVSVATERQEAVIQPYPGEGSIGVFDAGAARIESAGGEVLEERLDARSAFFGLSGLRRRARWDELDALYFAGYALWNYLNIPFLFENPGFEVSEGDALAMDGESWSRLDVTFPEQVHTHCRKQTFYFDSRGLLRRHDYHPDVVSSLANAAHLCDAHLEVGGLVLPTERRVVPKGLRGRPLRGPTIVSLSFDSIRVD